MLCTIAHNFVLHHYVKEIKNFEQQNFLSDMHQNLNSTKLYQDEYKVSSIAAYYFLRFLASQYVPLNVRLITFVASFLVNNV